MIAMTQRVLVIGGGIAGTSAAFHLRQYGYGVTIAESNDRLGGRVHSQLCNGIAIEMGAGFLNRSYTNLLEFLRQQGLDTKMYSQKGSVAIFRDREAQPLMARQLLGKHLLSWPAKARAVPLAISSVISSRQADPHAMWRMVPLDTQSVADKLGGKSKNELLEYIVQPVLNSYFYWDPEHTSAAILPFIARLILGKGTYKLSGGLQQIPLKAAQGCTVWLNTKVTTVKHLKSGRFSVSYVNNGNENQRHTASFDAIVCATTASAAAKILPGLTKHQRRFFSGINYSSTALVAQAYPRSALTGNRAVGFPRSEEQTLSVVTGSAEQSDRQVEIGNVKVYGSGKAGKRLVTLDDAALKAKLLSAAKLAWEQVLTPGAQPIATYIQRWPEAIPLFETGHFKKLAAFKDGEIESPTQALVFAGDYLGGPFMEGAFTSGLQAAKRLHQKISHA
jgi:oxygen-dependent protoporphyrinogen oxidase